MLRCGLRSRFRYMGRNYAHLRGKLMLQKLSMGIGDKIKSVIHPDKEEANVAGKEAHKEDAQGHGQSAWDKTKDAGQDVKDYMGHKAKKIGGTDTEKAEHEAAAQGHKESAKGNYGDAKDHGLAAKDHMNTAADHKKEANKVEAQRKVDNM